MRSRTRKAAEQLKWIGADKVTGVKEYKELLKIEQDEYQSQFAAALEKKGFSVRLDIPGDAGGNGVVRFTATAGEERP